MRNAIGLSQASKVAITQRSLRDSDANRYRVRNKILQQKKTLKLERGQFFNEASVFTLCQEDKGTLDGMRNWSQIECVSVNGRCLVIDSVYLAQTIKMAPSIIKKMSEA